ncbi:MAG: aspartate--tRNA ligase [Bacilli bacterium]|nr:aspartate--tRNA ligase [Bacilli bacterium]MBR0194055.1 aspartate--tRNA ligase [Bacilli bacterium]
MNRSCYNTDLSLKDVGREVSLVGWVSKKRNLGALQFIDLRDRSGIIQVTVREGVSVPDVRNEYVIRVEGVVHKKDVPNKALKTGEIEILAKNIEVFSKANPTPMIIADNTDALEDVRLKYRYLDLRRPVMRHNLEKRAQIVKAAHQYFDENGFIEVETPCLTLSTPEGARDYIVPSRVSHGCFYALPQSPQLFKQLLMIGGFERYYQIARCFRDEDLRQDRQPEFTQIDLEMSFLDQDEILTLMEGFLKKVFKETVNYDLALPLRRLPYKEAVDVYGSDKPDTRFELHLKEVTDVLKKTEFNGYKSAESIKALVIPGVAPQTSRKVIDGLTLEAKKFGFGGIGVYKVNNGALESSLAKFMNEAQMKELMEVTGAKEGDLILVLAGAHDPVCFALGALRTKYAHELGYVKPNTYDLLWVVDFPLFEKDMHDGSYKPLHHPFTRPTPETAKYLDSDPSKVLSAAYDIVINGYEAGGGSLRIYDQDMQKKIFNILGFTNEDITRKFGYFVKAFEYGTPPHGGIAFGLERLSMIICGTDNIRDVIAFPKNLKATCPMSNAPEPVDEAQLKDVGIKIAEE